MWVAIATTYKDNGHVYMAVDQLENIGLPHCDF